MWLLSSAMEFALETPGSVGDQGRAQSLPDLCLKVHPFHSRIQSLARLYFSLQVLLISTLIRLPCIAGSGTDGLLAGPKATVRGATTLLTNDIQLINEI